MPEFTCPNCEAPITLGDRASPCCGLKLSGLGRHLKGCTVLVCILAAAMWILLRKIAGV